MRRQGPLDSIGTILSGIAHRFGLEAKMLECRLRREWPNIVGEQIAAHTRPDQIRFKKLYLSVHNSVWLQQLTYLKPVLLQKVNEVAGQPVVSEIVLRIGEFVNERQGENLPSASADLSPPPTDQAITEATAHAHAVKDPELRDRLTAVMAAALDRLTPGRRSPGPGL